MSLSKSIKDLLDQDRRIVIITDTLEDYPQAEALSSLVSVQGFKDLRVLTWYAELCCNYREGIRLGGESFFHYTLVLNQMPFDTHWVKLVKQSAET